MKKYIVASFFLLSASIRAQDLSSILFIENPLLRSFSIEQREHLLRISEGKKSGNPFVINQLNDSLNEWKGGLKKRISIIKNVPCKITKIGGDYYKSSDRNVVSIVCTSISGFAFEAGIRRSEVPRESLTIGDVMYLSAPIDKLEDYDSIESEYYGGFKITVQGAILRKQRGPISQALLSDVALEKCLNFKSIRKSFVESDAQKSTIESILRKQGYIKDDGPKDDGPPKCEDLGRFPDFSGALKSPP